MAAKKKAKKKSPAAQFKKYSKEVLALARAFAKARHARVSAPKKKPAKKRAAPKKKHHAKKHHAHHHASHDPSWYGHPRLHAKAAKKGHRRQGHHVGRDPVFVPMAAMGAMAVAGDPARYTKKRHGGVKKGSAAAKAWGRKMAAARKRSGK